MRGLSRLIQAMHPVAPGQAVFTANAAWIVPPGVFEISALCMQRGTVAGEAWAGVPAARIVRAGLDVVRAQNGNRLGDGGGDGGMSGSHVATTNGEAPYNQVGGGGGGGGGGYNGPGGDGGNWTTGGPWAGGAAAANSGGGGGGMPGANSYPPAGGGGVGLEGLGPTGGSVSAWPSAANPGSYGDAGATPPTSTSQSTGSLGGFYGGAQGDMRTGVSYSRRGRGGANAWRNNIPVYPGEVLQIFVEGNGGVRLMWGGGRSYPSNAAGIWPTNWYRYFQLYITATAGGGVPAIGELELRATAGGADITSPSSLCTASSQYDGSTPASKVVANDGSAFAGCWMAANGSAGNPPKTLIVRPSMDVVLATELAIWPVSGYLTWAPGSFVVRGSFNGAAWTDIKSFSGVTGWVANTPKTFSLI